MKNSKKILVVAMSMVMILATIIPGYASFNINSYTTIPDDIGQIASTVTTTLNQVSKYYLVINRKTNVVSDEYVVNINYLDNSDNSVNGTLQMFYTRDDGYMFTVTNFNLWQSFILYPNMTCNFNNINIAYIPVYIRNVTITNYEIDNEYYSIKFYESTSDESVIAQEAFNIGYNNGYDVGYHEGLVDGAEIVQDLNLVEHCEQLLGTFVGDEYAHYITPLCLALVVILIYFLFIRWLLALVKSKNVTRVADIIVCTACIIMLVIMYAPMLDLTIKQAQTVYQIAADTVVGG